MLWIFFLLMYYANMLKANENNLLSTKYALNKSVQDDDLCILHFNLYINGIFNEEEWALKMYDATSKLQSGVLFGNLYELGNFNECLSVNENLQETTIQGKYCLGSIKELKLSTLMSGNIKRLQELTQSTRSILGQKQLTINEESGLFWAGCIPASCSSELATNLTNNVEFITVQIQFHEEMCTSMSTIPSIDAGDIAVMCVFGSIILLIILSTSYEFYLLINFKKTRHPVLLSFSAYTNTKKLFTITKSDDQLSCLNGIRVISIMWVIIGHSYTFFLQGGGVANTIDINKWLDSGYSMYIIGATVSVDTFFVLGGLLMTYSFLQAISKGIKFNVLKYYIHRYIRLTPALLGIILIHLTLLKHFGSGPFWNYFISHDGCKLHWWPTLLYIKNYINLEGNEDQCVGHSWYLMIDMQLFILSPLILLPLWKWPRKTLFAVILLIIVAIAVPFTIAWINEYPSSLLWPDLHVLNQMMQNVYIKTHCRAAPWLIGIVLGYFIFQHKKIRPFQNIYKNLNTALTGMAFSVLCVCVFAGNDLYKKEYNKLEHSAHIAFLRPSWALAVSWLIFACITNKAVIINWFLSLPIFQIIGRFTYSMYLLNLTIMYCSIYSRKVPEYFSDFIVVYRYWGDFFYTFFLSYFWVLMFESPMIVIEKYIFGRETKRTQ